jgi:integrase
MSTTTLGSLVFAFFEDYLKAQKGLSPATVKSYRDALRLLLLFVARELGSRVTRVQLAELTAERVRGFLQALESERHNHVRSRNQRLAAVKTFFEYLAAQLPERLAEAERVMAIPVKRVAPPPTFFLERDEVQSLFAQLPTSGPYALRDRTLLLFLYNTGARVLAPALSHRPPAGLFRERLVWISQIGRPGDAVLDDGRKREVRRRFGLWAEPGRARTARGPGRVSSRPAPRRGRDRPRRG